MKDGRVALIERRRSDELFYLFPGGQVGAGEKPAEAAEREVREGLGLHVCIERLVADVSFEGTDQLYYSVRITDGQFGETGPGPEMHGDQGDPESHVPVWMPCRGLSGLPVFPRAVALLVEFSGNGWPHEVLRITDRGGESRAVAPAA